MIDSQNTTINESTRPIADNNITDTTTAQQENTPSNLNTLINTTHKSKSKKSKPKRQKPKKSLLAEQTRLIELIESVEQKYLDIEYNAKQQELKQQQHEHKQQQQLIQHEHQQLINEQYIEQPAIVDRDNLLSKLVIDQSIQLQWNNYIECYYNLPKIDIESELTTYVTLYNELYHDKQHGIYNTPEQYIQQLLNHINIIEQLNILLLHNYNKLREQYISQQHNEHNKLLYYYWSYKNILRGVTHKHIDLLTACIIYHSDRLENYDTKTINYSSYSHSNVQINTQLSELYNINNINNVCENSCMSYGIWIHNSSKHGRVKRVVLILVV